MIARIWHGAVPVEKADEYLRLQAISRFAGEDVEAAKYYEFDRDFLIELEPTVKHFDVVE